MPRKKKFSSPRELYERCQEYFDKCEGTIMKDKDGKPVFYKGVPIREGYSVPTWNGLQLFLGYTNKQALYKMYQREKEQADKGLKEFDVDSFDTWEGVYEWCRLKLEESTVQASMNRESFQGARIQLLTHYGYTDKPVAEINVNNTVHITKEEAEKAMKLLGYKKE